MTEPVGGVRYEQAYLPHVQQRIPAKDVEAEMVLESVQANRRRPPKDPSPVRRMRNPVLEGTIAGQEVRQRLLLALLQGLHAMRPSILRNPSRPLGAHVRDNKRMATPHTESTADLPMRYVRRLRLSLRSARVQHTFRMVQQSLREARCPSCPEGQRAQCARHLSILRHHAAVPEARIYLRLLPPTL